MANVAQLKGQSGLFEWHWHALLSPLLAPVCPSLVPSMPRLTPSLMPIHTTHLA